MAHKIAFKLKQFVTGWYDELFADPEYKYNDREAKDEREDQPLDQRSGVYSMHTAHTAHRCGRSIISRQCIAVLLWWPAVAVAVALGSVGFGL